jgi:ferredoxin-NADP reductase
MHEPIITVAQYLQWRQPDLFWVFRGYGLSEEPMTRDALALKVRVRESYVFRWWKKIMEEVPGFGD